MDSIINPPLYGLFNQLSARLRAVTGGIVGGGRFLILGISQIVGNKCPRLFISLVKYRFTRLL